MIFVAIGANLPGSYLSPRHACETALQRLEARNIKVIRRSRWYETAPVPVSDQPWYVNGVAAVETSLSAAALLTEMHAVESEMGRVRSEVNAPRVIDLDLLAFNDAVSSDWPVLPHPRLHVRAFVLLPLAEIAPDWVHPVSGQPVSEMIAALPTGQQIRLLGE